MLSKEDEAIEPQKEIAQSQSSQERVVSTDEVNQDERPTIGEAKFTNGQDQSENNLSKPVVNEHLAATSDNDEVASKASDKLLLPTSIDEQTPQISVTSDIDVDKIDESSAQEVQPVEDHMKADDDAVYQTSVLPEFNGDSQQIVADDEKCAEAEIERSQPAEDLDHSENVSQAVVEGDLTNTNTTFNQTGENSASQVAEYELGESNDEFMTSDEDFQSVAAFYSISIELLKSNRALFTSLMLKFSDFEKLKSSNQYLEINYEQLQHSQKKKMELAKKELTSVKSELEVMLNSQRQLVNDKNELESALKNSNSLTTKNSRYVDDLKLKLQELEKNKLNLSELLEVKQNELNELNEEMKTLADEKKKLREIMLDLESSKEGTTSELMTSKFEVAKLQRELKLLSDSRDWFEAELKRKISEFDRFRSEQSLKYTTVSSELNALKQNYEISQTSLKHYSTEITRLSSKNDESQFQIKGLSDKLQAQEKQFMEQISKRDEHIQVLEKSNKDKSQRITSLDKVYADTAEKVKNDEEEYKSLFENLKSELISKDVKIEELEKMVSDLSNNGAQIDGAGFKISLLAQKTLKDVNSELSLSDLLSELNSLRKEVVKEKRAKTKAENELSNFLKEFERKWPLLESYKDKCEDLQNREEKVQVMLDNLTNDKSNLSKNCEILKKKVNESQLQIRNLNKLKVDLQRQLVILLTEIQFKVSGENLLTIEEKSYINKIVSSYGELRDVDETDTDRLITSRLATFKNTTELIKQNEQLLAVSRKLGSELESRDLEGKGYIDETESSTIQKAKEAISKLQEKIKALETQLKAASNSRDMLQNLFDSGAAAVGDKKDIEANNERLNLLLEEVKFKKEELANVRKSYDTRIFELNSHIQSVMSEKSNITLQLSKEKSANELNNEKISNLQSSIAFVKKENEQLKSMLDKSQNNLGKLEEKLQIASNSLVSSKSSVIEFEIKAKTLVAEKEVYKSVEDQLRKDIDRLYNEKADSNRMIIQLQTLDSERQAHFKETIQRYTNNTQSLQRELDMLRDKLDKSNSEISNILHSKNVDSKVYQRRIDLLVEELGGAKTALNNKEKLISELNEEVITLKKRHANIDERKQSVLSSIANSSASNDDTEVLKEELQNALEDLEVAAKDASQYKELSVATEQQLSSLNDAYEQYKNIAEEKISSLTTEVESLKSSSAKLEEERDALKQEAISTKYDADLAEQGYNSKLEELNSSISTFDSIKQDYEKKLDLVKSDVKSKDQVISELNGLLSDKSNQIENLKTINDIIKKENADLREKISTIEGQISESNKLLSDEREKNKDSITKIEQEVRNDKIRISELETQNRTLLNQLEESPLAFGESDDMKGLVAYLNREKDSLSQQLQYVQEEESTLRQNVSSKEKEIAELKSELAVVREKSSTIDKYSDALTKMKGEVEELKVYKDNNNALRDQVKSYESKIKELESRIAESSNKFTPLTAEIENLKAEIIEKNKQLAQFNEQIQSLSTQVKDNAVIAGQKVEKDKLIEELQSKYAERNQVVEKLKNQFNERIKKMRFERQQALDESKELSTKVQSLEGQLLSTASAPKAADEETERLKSQIRSLKEEVHQKTIQNSTIARESAEKLNKISEELATLKKELADSKVSGPAKQQSEDLVALEQKYIKEKEQALKNLELELKSKGSSMSSDDIEEFKKKLKAENDAQLHREIEAHKTRVRAPTQAKINEIVEKRVKAKSDELEKQHEEKMKELQSKYSSSSGASEKSGNFAQEKERLLKTFDAEKEQLKKEIRAAVEKEKGFKEKFLQGKISRLEEQVKNLEEERKKLKSQPLPNMPMVPNMVNMGNMPPIPFGQGGMFSGNNAFGNAFQPSMNPFNMAGASSNSKGSNSFKLPNHNGNNGNNGNNSNNGNVNTSGNKDLPSKPTKRAFEDGSEPEKRPKTE